LLKRQAALSYELLVLVGIPAIGLHRQAMMMTRVPFVNILQH